MSFVQNPGGFWPARFPVGGVPSVKVVPQAAAPTFKKGYPVVATAGLLDECGVNPAAIAGVALQDNSTNPGYAMANSPTVITGQSTTASLAVANDSTIFVGQLTNGSAVIVAPANADIAAQYGITKFTNDWRVDKSKTAGNARVIIIDIDTTNNLVYFKFLKANQQYSA